MATPGEPEIVIGEDRRFTFDGVFDQTTSQRTVYEKCVEKLIEGTFDGFNATVLAYGQTGSGKTYTMGTAIDVTGGVSEMDIGIIPRAMQHLFDGIESRKAVAREGGLIEPIFDVAVQFIELYNECIVDLLSDDRTGPEPRVHEDANGEIFVQGVASRTVNSPHETLEVLKNGALNRTTASTNMNEQSSRSHAIFTVLIKQQRVVSAGSMSGTASEFEVLTAKFHFVDLAGSERLKRTGATGDRAKEGISINCGLLSLGNVICALGKGAGKVTHVPYRDSKLTRLLQDSLGGNSQTLMIACVSPSDCDFVETLNTLKYANRAKEIKNKVIANQDKSSKLISGLRTRILELEAELVAIKQGKITIGADGVETFNDQYQENIMLRAELEELRIRIKAMQETNETLKARNVQLLFEKQSTASLTESSNLNGLLQLKDDLADLQTEITIKERLVMELERSERRLAEVRIIYEKKLTELSLKIAATEAERDRVLNEMGYSAKLDAEHVKRIKDEYEKKLKEMRSEFKKLQSVEREHRKMRARQVAEQQQLVRLRNELNDLKKTKVILQNLETSLCRKKDNIIKQLETKERQRELYIKKTNEEVVRLRQLARQEVFFGCSFYFIGYSFEEIHICCYYICSHQIIFSNCIQLNIFSYWQTVMKMEEELERRFSERYAVYDEIQELVFFFVISERDLIGEQIDGLQVKENYIQDQITELQRAIIDVDNDNDKESEPSDSEINSKIENIIGKCGNISEAKYLLQRLFVFSLERGFLAAKAQSDQKESEARIQQLEQEKVINESLLSQVIEDKDIVGEVTQVLSSFLILISSSEKARQRTATTDELLYSKENKLSEPLESIPEGNRTRSNTPEEELSTSTPSTPRSSKKFAVFSVNFSSSFYMRDTSKLYWLLSTSSVFSLQNAIIGSLEKVGRILTYTPRTATGQRDKTAATRLLTRTHTLDGHTKSVLSLAADETKLLTGSKDRLVKLWDLERGVEKCTLGLHPNNVLAVKFIPGTDLALSVSMSTVRLWDLRMERCIRILLSSGLAVDADSIPSNTSRQNTVPISETVITAADLDPTGRLLFTTFAGDVRIWDLEKVAAYGRLISAPHSPRSEVSCLAVTNDRPPVVFTGSRDHYVKMYEVTAPNGEGMYEACAEFVPPHYDNVTCILPYGDSVFTASKDTNIMRFSLRDLKRDHLELKAHNKWILGMCLLEGDAPILASVCKGGAVKLWDITTTRKIRLIEEISQAHAEAINCITTNSRVVFTASNDSTVGFWHLSRDAS
ncbi:unnamed protein product [Enterobius vermicularis]|uniref:Kinesin motor domain-containing protein n=1 Tax=Enterobius vermicularis TaxID=51028 RepID=A0A158QAS8_ENTVE|nr:unnamed protein product [Enterobius vermicularis]